MKKFAKIVAMAGLFLGGMMVSGTAFAQGDAANSEKATSKNTVVTSTPAKSCGTSTAAKSCCASKGSAHASQGTVKETASNAGHASCEGKKAASCDSKAAASCSSKTMGGNVSETSSNAGSSKKECSKESGKKSCCASKNAESK